MSYSIVCKRCGRKLRSEASRNRGYGSYCYRKIANDEKRDKPSTEEMNSSAQIEQIERQMSLDKTLKQMDETLKQASWIVEK